MSNINVQHGFSKALNETFQQYYIAAKEDNNAQTQNNLKNLQKLTSNLIAQMAFESVVQHSDSAEFVKSLPHNAEEILQIAIGSIVIDNLISELEARAELAPKEAKVIIKDAILQLIAYANEQTKRLDNALQNAGFMSLEGDAKSILTSIFKNNFGVKVEGAINSVWNIKFFIDNLLSGFNTSSEESMKKDIAVYISFGIGVLDDLNTLPKLPSLLETLVPRGILGNVLRSNLYTLLAYLDFNLSYAAAKYILSDVTKALTGTELYEKDWFIKLADSIYPYILNDLAGTELDSVTIASIIISNTFKDDDGKPISSEDINFLLGGDKYRKMDYHKVKHVYQGLYNLMSGKTERLPINTSQEFKEHLQSKQVVEQYRGVKLIPLNGFTPEFMSRQITEPDPISISWRYALKNLNSFVVEDASFYTEARLGTEQFDSLKLFDVKDLGTASGMTEEYIRHRLNMLQLLSKNEKDPLYIYKDYTSQIAIASSKTIDYIRSASVIFGTDGDDKNGVLSYTPNNDYIFSGTGNDFLNGGDGSDYLEGSTGHDVYQFKTNDNGIDTIFDSDGDGSLEIDDINLGKQTFSGIADPKSPKAGDAYYSEDKKYGMTYNGVNWEFSVQDAPGHYQALAHLRHWQNGQLGISLKHADDPDADPALVDFDLDHRNNRNYIVYDGTFAPNGIKVHGSNFASSQFTGSGRADVIHTGDGVLHRVVTGNGGDTVKGGAGREYINAGIKNPKAEDDNDTVYAGDNSDIVLGGAGRDEIWAGNEHEDYDTAVIDYKKYEGVTDPESLKIFEREKRGDWVHGQYGNDTIYGSAKEDILIGGEGFDTIRGGAGKDLILGDADYIPFATSPAIMGRIIGYRWSADGTVPRPKEEGVMSLPNGNVFSWQWKTEVKEKDSGNESWDFTISPGPSHTALLRNDRFQQLENGNWNDTIYGGEGDDIIFGQLGDDTIHGGDGDDVLHGDDFNPLPDNMPGGKDTLYGGAGNDRLFAGGGNATMNGGSGNDIYHSGKGNDTMTDESGDDVYWLSSGLDGVNDQGSGYDTYHIAFDGSMISGFTTISDGDGKGSITYRGKVLTADQVQATGDNEWRTNDGTAKLTRMGSSLVITNALEDFKGRIIFNGFFNTGESLGLKLPSLDDDNKPNPDPKTQPDPKPQPEQPQAPTAGKPLAAQSIHEKEKLTYTLAEDTFHTANKDDKLTYSARLADGKPLPGWLSFNPQTRTFSGTPSNDDVGMLNVEISAKGKGGSANQRFTLNVINVNDAPQAGQKLPTLQIEHNKLFYYQLPEDAFKDIDKNDKLTFSATSENGQSLPSWLKFDAYNGTFTGSPSANTPQGNYRVTVTVTDSGGLKAHQTLVLNLAQGTPLKPVNGTDRNDILISSADNELLAGKGGKDVYQFSRGFGHDLINNHDENSNQDDVVTFTNMNRKDFVIMRDYTSLYLRSLSGTDELRIMGQFPANSKWRIGEIRFADGSILTADEIERELQKTTEGDDHIYGSKDNDIINGKGGNDVISGEEGDDELYGEDGNDNLIGSVGNDKLSGGAGEDSLNGGDGRDHLSGGAGNDELIGGEDDDQLHGNEGDDKLYGGTGNDLLIGDSGNDVLSGSAGNDIYRFARGFGHDVINNYDGGLGRHDSIDFSDMNRSDFDIRREGNNLVLHSKDGKNQITVTNHFFNGWQIDSIRFADGTTLDHGAINSAVSTQNAPRGNYMHPAAQALQMNQMIASLNNQAQPLHALAIPDEKQPLLAAVNPY